jgi:septal ring factor EnvC (AmiA/AmiB activator)
VFAKAETEDPAIIRQQIDYQKKQIKKLKKNISAKTRKMAEVNLEKVSVLKQLKELDTRLADQWVSLENTRKQWSAVELQLAETQKKITRLKTMNRGVQQLVEKRLRALREMGTMGLLNVLFSASSLPEMMSREANLRLILNHDRIIRQDFAARLRKLQDEEKELEEKSRELAQLAEKIDQERKSLRQTRRDRKAFLEELEKEGKRYASMIAEMRDAEKSLDAIVTRLAEEAEKAEQARLEARKMEEAVSFYDTAAGGDGFAGQRGRLITPAPGSIVIPAPSQGKRIAGIIFACPWGSPIKAIYDGTVILTKNMLGYGRIMIIDHGDQFFTLTGQAVQFFKNPGDKIYEGETIGMSGGGPWIDEGIYFEIRHGEYQENPLRWLDIRGVKIIKGRQAVSAVH